MLNKYIEKEPETSYCGYDTRFDFSIPGIRNIDLDKISFDTLPSEACFAKLFREIRRDFGNQIIKDKPVRVKLLIYLTTQQLEQKRDNLCLLDDIEDIKTFVNYFQNLVDYTTKVEIEESKVGDRKKAVCKLDITFNTWRNYGNDVRLVLTWIRYLYEGVYRSVTYEVMRLKKLPEYSDYSLYNLFLLVFERSDNSGNSGHYIGKTEKFVTDDEIRAQLDKNSSLLLNNISMSYYHLGYKKDPREGLPMLTLTKLAPLFNNENATKRAKLYKACLNRLNPMKNPLLVHVVGSATHYADFLKKFALTDDIEKAQVIIFTGGEDVSPQLYGKEKHKTTYCNINRDLEEYQQFNKIRGDQLVVGICRGSQFLCVMNGGILVQNCNNHTGTTHNISSNADVIPFGDISITSTHHQMQYPYNLDPAFYTKLYTAEGLATKYEGEGIDVKKIKEEGEPEIILYHSPGKPKCLAIQGHPEMMNKTCYTVEVINDIIEMLLKGEEL